MSVLPPIVLKKSFLGDEQNFLEPLMRLASGDVRDHIFSHKNDHGPSYRRYGALLRWRRQKINFRRVFGPVRFSTFATVSPDERTYSESVGTSQRRQIQTSTLIANRIPRFRAERRFDLNVACCDQI